MLVHNADYKITLSREKYPESAKHIEDAIKNGQPRELTINRSGAKSNIKASLKGISKVSGKDLDEYPFAMCKEGGKGLMFVQSKDPIIEVQVLLLGIN
ncbi:NucA/NucB deoxyribonuclease domain-containing protein [Ruminococcus sp. AM43-6]|uniref:NucA/NucB deoxyribonuclease domain-containing protein n=1 Tax=Ruminococcus sp. AM43-6 TaxID=2293216 RepID=UPI001FA8333F|nr:NucA/NucB deoxyribonuclease domain-containing protein [Ruminococcus sp. AM43-6]